MGMKLTLVLLIAALIMIAACSRVPAGITQVNAVNTSDSAAEDIDNMGSNGIQIRVVSIAEVALHNSKEDCWIAIHGKVYEMTDFIKVHPGGDAILQGCGADGTDLYETRPMGSGTSHSQDAMELLDQYYIGVLY